MKKWTNKKNECPICGSMVRFGTETVKCSNEKCPGEWKLVMAKVGRSR